MERRTRDRAAPLRASAIVWQFFTTLWYLRTILLVLLVLFVMLTIGMYHFGGPVETANRSPSPMGETVYFCAITALTIGYGDVVPSSTFGRIDAVCLGLIGLVFTGLFVAAAVRGVQEAAHRTQAGG
jgi:voltage-gated potassium channel